MPESLHNMGDRESPLGALGTKQDGLVTESVVLCVIVCYYFDNTRRVKRFQTRYFESPAAENVSTLAWHRLSVDGIVCRGNIGVRTIFAGSRELLIVVQLVAD